MNSVRLKEIMTAQSKAGVGRLELNFETAFEVVEALEQAEQAVARVRALCVTPDGDLICPDFDGNTVGDILRALDGEQS